MQRSKTKSLPSFEAMPAGDRQTSYARRMWRTFYQAARITTNELDPIPCRVAVLALAHTGAETAYGASLYGWNVGNVGAQSDAESYYASQDTMPETKSDGSVTNKVYATKFRWYPTALAGVGDYLKVVRDRPRYAKAWAAMLAGDPYYLIELRHGGYFFGRSYVHPGESIARLDTDEELLAVFVQHVQRVNDDTQDLRPNRGRFALGASLVATIGLGATLTTLRGMAAD